MKRLAREMRKRGFAVMAILLLGATATACGSTSSTSSSGSSGSTGSSSSTSSTGSSSSTSSTSGTSTSSSSSNSSAPLKGKTITLIVPGSPGASHDLFARAIAPELASQLQATVHVVDMPGGGGLKGDNYTAAQKPNGLTLCIGNIEGILANVWETVPGQNFDPTKLTFMGGEAGMRGDLMYVLLTNKTKKPFDNIGDLINSKQPMTELGAVGDVTGPLFFKMYGLNARDLTSFASAGAEKQALLAGNGDLLVKFYSPWVDIIKSGKASALIAYTLRSKWNADPSVPTLGAIMKKYPPKNQAAAKGETLDVTALDAGTMIFGPPGIPSNIATAEQNAVKAAFASQAYQTLATKAHVGLVFASAAQELQAIQSGLTPATVKMMKSVVPQSKGEAS